MERVRIISIQSKSADGIYIDTDHSLIGQIGLIHPMHEMTLPNGNVVQYIDDTNQTEIVRQIKLKSNYNILITNEI